MAKNGMKVMDSDMHIIEPPDLWERYIDPKYRDRAPKGWSGSGSSTIKAWIFAGTSIELGIL